MLQRGRRARSEGSCIPELSLLPPSASSELWCGQGGPSGAGAAQVTRSPGLQVSQTTAHIPALPRGRPTPALCSLALPHLWQLPPPPGLFLPVSSLVSKGPGGRGCCRSGRGPQTSQCPLSSSEKSAWAGHREEVPTHLTRCSSRGGSRVSSRDGERDRHTGNPFQRPPAASRGTSYPSYPITSLLLPLTTQDGPHSC